jgi:hypothetical protein
MSPLDAEQELRQRHAPLLRAVAEGAFADEIADARVVALPGKEPPWTDTGVELAAGEAISVLAAGRVVLSEELGLWFGPRVYLWRRIGEAGPIFRAARETATHRAARAGRFYLGIYPGSWASPAGDYEGAAPFGGGFAALLLRWRGDPLAGLRAIERRLPGDALVRAEIERLEALVPKPAGFEPLWYVGESDLFRAAEVDGRAVIQARPENDAAIVKHPLATDLTPDTRLRWSWRFEALPSSVAENQLHTHDYISIALEFDNGQDLTWYWSAALPEETIYRCPLPWWDQRETHVAIRTGAAELGGWKSEARNVYDDYRAALGEPPRRIVGLWLIAVSLFGHGRGAADFAEIALEQPEGRLRVY